MSDTETKIEIKRLFKIFGDQPESMLEKVRGGSVRMN